MLFLSEILLGGGVGVVVHDLHGIGVHDDGAVVGVAVQELRGILQAEVPPVVAQDCVGDIGGAVVHGGVGRLIALNEVKVLVQRLKLRIPGPLQDPGLDPERLVGGGRRATSLIRPNWGIQ